MLIIMLETLYNDSKEALINYSNKQWQDINKCVGSWHKMEHCEHTQKGEDRSVISHVMFIHLVVFYKN